MIPEPQAELVDEHPTVDDARQALDTGQPYRGIWHTPAPDPTAVHLFAGYEYRDELLLEAGWTRTDAPPPA